MFVQADYPPGFMSETAHNKQVHIILGPLFLFDGS